MVAKVSADLANDGGNRIRQEFCADGHVEANHGVDQAEARDLLEIFKRLTSPAVAIGNVVGRRKAALHNAVSEKPVCRRVGIRLVELSQHLADFGELGSWPFC